MKAAPDVLKAPLAHMPLGRYGDPENDVAPVVLALVSSDFNYVTGQTIMVDGGAAILSPACALTRASRLLRKETQQPRRLFSPATKRERELRAAAKYEPPKFFSLQG